MPSSIAPPFLPTGQTTCRLDVGFTLPAGKPARAKAAARKGRAAKIGVSIYRHIRRHTNRSTHIALIFGAHMSLTHVGGVA